MAKVITSAGLNDFIESGKTETMEKPKTTESKVEKVEKVEAKVEPVKVEEKEAPVEADGDLMPEETLEQAKAKIAKKHRELKAEKALRLKIQEERDENERLAESQYNQRRLVETERDRLGRELEELKLRAQPQLVPELKAPDKDDPKFKNEKNEFQWDKFTDAQAEYRVEQFKIEQKEQQQATERAALEIKVKERLDVTKAKYPDFEEAVAARVEKDIPPYVMQFLMESEQVGELSYYFAKNREELTKILKLSPIMALARLGKIESRFETKVEPKTEVETPKVEKAEVRTSPPPPITPISGQGAGTVTTDPSKMDFKQLRAFEREKNKRKG